LLCSSIYYFRGGQKPPKSKEAIPKEAIPKEAIPKEAIPKEAIPKEAIKAPTFLPTSFPGSHFTYFLKICPK
jgi:hypothetical protein